MAEIDQVIDRVERLYHTVTGKDAPAADTPYAPIPAEKDPATHVEEQINRLFDALGVNPPQPPWAPAIAIWESPSDVIVYADVPGVARERVEVSLDAGVLVIAGHRTAPVANGHRLYFGERAMGPFRRLVPLPPGLKTGELAARLRDGVLEVVIPRETAVGANPRPVPIS